MRTLYRPECFIFCDSLFDIFVWHHVSCIAMQLNSILQLRKVFKLVGCVPDVSKPDNCVAMLTMCVLILLCLNSCVYPRKQLTLALISHRYPARHILVCENHQIQYLLQAVSSVRLLKLPCQIQQNVIG